jgi:ammonia channel protein AmtB
MLADKQQKNSDSPFTLSLTSSIQPTLSVLTQVFKWDDALDVWGVHGMGGFLGSIMLGPLSDYGINQAGTARSGVFFGKQVFVFGFVFVLYCVCLCLCCVCVCVVCVYMCVRVHVCYCMCVREHTHILARVSFCE